MLFVIGFLIWLGLGLAAGAVVRTAFRAPGTAGALTFIFAVLGALVGGMLGMAAYVYHHPIPTRPAGLIGAALGALVFSSMYHFIARKAV
jgi:uncharacterized membrane protein YeaQ/YmgE (transglycosylase-associated protein family)